MGYEDFVVQLGPRTARGIEVRASCPLAGEASSVFTPEAPERLTERFTTCLERGRRAVGADATAREIGGTLFDSIFDGPVRHLFDRSLGRLEGDRGLGLRITLRFDVADEHPANLQSLPWELLYRAETADFLSLSRRTPVVRSLDLPRAVERLDRPPVLRVLALAPEPRGLPPLDVARERNDLHLLERSLQGLAVDFLAPAHLGALRRALVEGEHHVLHLMGHAEFDPATGRGVVCLEDAEGRAEVIRADSLVAVVGDARSLRLAVLNACNTGRVGGNAGAQPFLGLAPALMRAGLPAVVAMQSPISDGAAIAFGEALYRRLVAGDPVDAAVTEGRHAIHARAPRSLEWAIPVLFVRTTSTVVLRAAEAQSLPPPSASPRGIDHLRAGNFKEAIAALRQELVRAPDRGLPGLALGVALGRGRPLRQLPYHTAREMHRLFAAALYKPDARGPAAAALLALKVDYFEGNSVREPAPDRDEVVAAVAASAGEGDADWLTASLRISEHSRHLLDTSSRRER